MSRQVTKEQRVLEICLIVVAIGLTCLLYHFNGYKMVVLNLFYLPVVLAAFYLGRYRAGILALFCVIGASLVAVMNLDTPVIYSLPVVVALSIAVWGAVLGMTALLVGHLSDERQRKTNELQEAYVGVVEVMSQYLQSAHPKLKARSVRVAELSQQVAQELKLSAKQIEDIRVAALLYDMKDVEITARVIRRAMGSLEADSTELTQHTFQGKDLVLSLGSVLSGAMPLLLSRSDAMALASLADSAEMSTDIPLGAQVIEVVRAYESLIDGEYGQPIVTPQEALHELLHSGRESYDANVLRALERAVTNASREPVGELELVG
jgi:HD-GYP domain-containing protein (c-di-GMP phosphodiesterase class II)